MVLFEETQKISKTWKSIFIILLLICMMLFLLLDGAFLIGVILLSVFIVIIFKLKLNVKIYEDRLEYRLITYHVAKKVIMFDSIVGIDMVTAKQLGIYGFKIKNTPTGMVYYFGGGNIVRIRTCNNKDILFSICGINEIEKVLKL